MKNITPDLIPHEEFHKGAWATSEDGVKWYYFIKGKQNNGNITNKEFSSSLDKELRPLANLLHKNGIKTSPSCAGHFSPKIYFEKIWDGLKSHEEKIKGDGLKLIDPEANKHTIFKDSNYKIPWSKGVFLEKSQEYQKKGVIGVYKNSLKKSFIDWIKNHKIDNFSIKENDGIIFFITSPKNKKELENVWKNVYIYIDKYFKNLNEIKQIVRKNLFI